MNGSARRHSAKRSVCRLCDGLTLTKRPYTCDCSWKARFSCPGEDRSGLMNRMFGKPAADDGSACFAYCCGGEDHAQEAANRTLRTRWPRPGDADVSEITAMSSAEEMCGASDVIYTQTPGSTTCVEKSWLKPHATIICSGSDQPTKQEIPTDILKASKYVSDLTKQTSKVGELRSAIADGSMTEADVYAEIGEVCNGSKPGREGDELIVVDLTGTGAQDAAIGQVAWEKMG